MGVSGDGNGTIDDDEDDEDDDIDPFKAFLTATAENVHDLIADTTGQTDRASSSGKAQKARPDWGIPTFQEQCNGVNSYTLCRRNDSGQPICRCGSGGATSSRCRCSISVTLEHRRHSTGSDLWEAALVLAHALDRPIPQSYRHDGDDDDCSSSPNPDTVTTRKTTLWNDASIVLELGSGTGALGLYAAHVLGAHSVVLTDLPANLDLLRFNCNCNRNRNRNVQDDCDCHDDTSSATATTNVNVMALDWMDETLPLDLLAWNEAHCNDNRKKDGSGSDSDDSGSGGSVDLILGSDLFLPYAAHLLDPLARTIRDLLQQVGHADTTALIAYEERFDCTAFYEAATRYNLQVQLIDNDWLHPVYQDPGRIHVLCIRTNDHSST